MGMNKIDAIWDKDEPYKCEWNKECNNEPTLLESNPNEPDLGATSCCYECYKKRWIDR